MDSIFTTLTLTLSPEKEEPASFGLSTTDSLASRLLPTQILVHGQPAAAASSTTLDNYVTAPSNIINDRHQGSISSSTSNSGNSISITDNLSGSAIIENSANIFLNQMAATLTSEILNMSSEWLNESSSPSTTNNPFSTTSSPFYDESGYVPYTDRLETYIVPVLFAIIFIIGVLGNGVLILIFLRHRTMRNVPNMYICSLAVGDILVIIFCVPFTSTVYTVESWPYGLLVCKFSEFIKDVSIGVSVFTLTALSADRYFAIVDPMRKLTGCRATRITCITITGIWILSILIALPSVLFSYIRVIDDDPSHAFKVCYPFPPELGDTYPKVMVMFKFLVYYAIPLVFIATFYIIMAHHLVLSTKDMPGEMHGQTKQIQARKKVAKLILLFVCLFALCFFPSHVFLLWFYYSPNSEENFNAFWNCVRIAGFCLGFINSCINPITLYCLSGTFRKHFNQNLFCCLSKQERRNPRGRNLLACGACVSMSNSAHVNGPGHGSHSTGDHLHHNNHRNKRNGSSILHTRGHYGGGSGGMYRTTTGTQRTCTWDSSKQPSLNVNHHRQILLSNLNVVNLDRVLPDQDSILNDAPIYNKVVSTRPNSHQQNHNHSDNSNSPSKGKGRDKSPKKTSDSPCNTKYNCESRNPSLTNTTIHTNDIRQVSLDIVEVQVPAVEEESRHIMTTSFIDNPISSNNCGSAISENGSATVVSVKKDEIITENPLLNGNSVVHSMNPDPIAKLEVKIE